MRKQEEMRFGEADKICADFGITCAPFGVFKNARIIQEHQENLRINAAMLARQTDLAREAENKVAPLLEVCKWLLFHAESGRRWKTVAHQWLDFTEDEFEGRLREAIQKAEGVAI